MSKSGAARRARRAAAYGERPPGPSGWWHHRRYRRIAARGGRIPSEVAPEPVPFTPSPVNAAEATAWVIEQASELVPGAVDEVLGHALDNAINARADQWIAQVHSEFAQHSVGLGFRHGHADSTVTQEMRLQPPDIHRVIETETARNTAAVRLRGENEKPGWSQPGHADPTMLAGRPRGSYIYLLALLAAAAADIAAFYQVIQLVLGDLTTAWVIVLVIGFTGTALATAHFTGIMLRDRKAGAKWTQVFLIVIAAVAWAALGGLAFWVRLKSSAGTGGTALNLSVTKSSAGSGSVADPQGTAPAAAMFAGLYAATGTIALVGGYLIHNPLRAAFTQAVREHRLAAERHALSGRRLRLAEVEREFFAGQITATERVRDEAVLARLALAAELKQRARLELAKRLRDASATDAFLHDDARPYTYRPFPS
jgi:hypothetical protein